MGSSRRLHAREDAAAREVQPETRAVAIGAAHGERWRIERVRAPIATPPMPAIWVATDGDGRLVASAFDEHAAIEAHAARFGATLVERPGPASAAALEITEYLAGTRTAFDVELRLLGTSFQRAVWTALTRIPFGETRSYAEQARAIGRPTALRAVGAANGRNPIPLVVPCHRVVASDGGLGGFTGGLALKRRLLAHEAKVAGPHTLAFLAACSEHPNGPLFAT